MILELEKPFNIKWKKGYLREGKDGRKRVDLFNSNKDRTTISFARYLLSVSLGEEIDNGYEVDHKDGDRSNDSIENLVILSKEQHQKKTLKERPKRKFKILLCPVCNKIFYRYKNQIKPNTTPKCSRRCVGLFSKQNQGQLLSGTATDS